jgi:AraC family transcriptional regulator
MAQVATHTRTLFRSDGLRLGEFRCGPESAEWHGVNVIDGAPHIVFPGTSVVIRHVGNEPVLANRNHVMFYNADQRYRRRLHDKRGDHCHFVEIAPRLLAELAGTDPEAGFSFSHGPGDGRLWALVRLVVRHLSQERPDALLVEESLVRAVAGSVAVAFAFHQAPRPCRRPMTAAAHRGLVEAAKELLTETACDRLSLGDLGRRLHASEYHLARVFHAGTSFTLHGYRTQLRLRLALERLRDVDTNLTELAYELGFASHSHFTDAFRAAFGVPPSALRGEVGARRLRELRRIVEAPLRAAA